MDTLLAYTNSKIELPLKQKLLVFATQALTYIVPRPPVLQEMVTQVGDFYRQHRGRKSDVNYDGPVVLLLGASSENLPLASKYLYDYLERLLNVDPNDLDLLLLALFANLYAVRRDSPNSSYSAINNARFWQGQVKLNYSRFDRAIASQRQTNRSVAIYLLEHGHCSADDAISWYGGPAVIFEPADNLHFPRLSLAARILLYETQSEPERNLVNNTIEMNGLQIDKLKDALLNLPVPWYTSAGSAELDGIIGFVFENIDDISRRNASNSAILLIMAGIVDMTNSPFLGVRESGHRLENETDDGQLVALEQVVRARVALLGGSRRQTGKSRYRQSSASKPDQITINFLLQAGVDVRTAALIQAWSADPKFKFIAMNKGLFAT